MLLLLTTSCLAFVCGVIGVFNKAKLCLKVFQFSSVFGLIVWMSIGVMILVKGMENGQELQTNIILLSVNVAVCILRIWTGFHVIAFVHSSVPLNSKDSETSCSL